MRLQRFVIGISLVGFALSSSVAWAYRSGQVTADHTDLKQGPSDTSPTLETLKEGARFNATDTPVQGFYRVRTATTSGYLKEQDIRLSDGGTPATTGAEGAGAKKGKRRTGRSSGPRNEIRLLGAGTMAKPTDFTDAFGITSIGTVLSVGLEYSYLMGNRSTPWGIIARFEKLGQNLTLNDPVSTNTYAFAVASNQLYGGVFYRLLQDDGLLIRAAALVGYAFGTSATVTSASGTGGATQYSYSNFCLMPKIDFAYAWKISRSNEFTIFAEVGYRMAKSSAVPGTNGSGDNAFPTSNPLPSLALDLSGIFGGLGVGFTF